ncbi:MAG TPA: DUF2721 domain-containing protein [Phycisphaerae bacterium]|nr:DUF2721 domain-containing protein [Phycisphaerae bacterium]HRY69210.1 DUF2721 domain-containing protein [Phycisphaerae bacterium]HSA26171.1 DUF2721 domain-containing protein [Phycisphaerae bacterium]
MPAPELYSFISASVVPVVIISACGLLCLAFYNRLAYIVARLRSFHRELLTEQEEYTKDLAADPTDEITTHRHREVIRMLEVQTEWVYRRAQLIRGNLLCLLMTIACLTICSLSMGLATLYREVVYVSLATFVVGALFLLGGVILAAIEMSFALKPLELESRFVSRMSLELVKDVRKQSPRPEEKPVG